MSRVPTHPQHYALPSQPAYYPHPAPATAHYAPPDPGAYPYPRDGLSSSRGMDWTNSGEYNNAAAGPSRGEGAYGYAQSHRSPPDLDHPHRPPPTGPGAGWSSLHPSSASIPSMNQLPSAGRGAVKLEDLVAQDRAINMGRVPSSNGPGGFTSMPLNSANPPEPGRPAGGEGGNASQPSGPSEFIKKLYKMLEEESATHGKGRLRGELTRGSVGWGRGGSTFVVWDMNDFTTKVLPQTFRHSNFSSFVRQLNKYGFSKIKHVDEQTGQIKENIWEFQHPNFQAGGKSDLDTIKRKTVASKKGQAEGETEPPPVTRSAPAENDSGRIAEMESRIISLENRLATVIDELRGARNRETGTMTLLREMLGHLAAVENESANSPSLAASPRVSNLFRLFDQAAFGVKLPSTVSASSGRPFSSASHLPHSASLSGRQGHLSPHTDGGRSSGDAPSPAASKTSARPASQGNAVNGTQNESHHLPSLASQPLQSTTQDQPLFNGDSVEMTPMFADTPAWLTEGTNTTLAMYPRKSTDGAALRVMLETLTSQPASGRSEEHPPDPLVVNSIPPSLPDPMPAPVQPAMPTVQQSPFGTLIIPPASEAAPTNPHPENNAIRLSGSSSIKPHWTQSPRILVVEDDLVYRQLSSKFLEKFGCVTETVEDAQGAVDKMNQTKYDLVLMDIFFGPSMDGRKATSLIRQFDIYTPIISMTSNVQTQDVNSYLQSGMNDVLAKPFTKHGLFGILDKHLIHLKAIQLFAEVPRSLGVPPLSDQGVQDAITTSATQWAVQAEPLRNPLAAMGWSDDTYQIVLQQFIATGVLPDAAAISAITILSNTAIVPDPSDMLIGDHSNSLTTDPATISTTGHSMILSNAPNVTNGAIGTSVVFADSSGFNRKRSIETLDEGWSPLSLPGGGTMQAQGGLSAAPMTIPVVENKAKKLKK